MISKFKEIYKKHKIKLIYGVIIFVIINLLLQIYLFNSEILKDGDIEFIFLHWSEYCDGKNYSLQEKTDFCNTCYDVGGEKCNWPLDMNISVKKADITFKTGGEVHCYMVVDGVNYYTEKGKYYGLPTADLFTWEVIDATKNHEVEFCCGIERETAITKFIKLEKKWPQACVKKEVTPRCIK